MEENMNLPKHVAIILDGNRRWAKEHNLPIKLGHKEGAETLKKLVRYANKIGIKYVTVYAFSTENWKRSKEEVDALMGLLKMYIEDFSREADTENIVIRVLGERGPLSEDLKNGIKKTEERTANNTGTVFNICLNYGGRDEIVHAVKDIVKQVESGKLSIDEITEDVVTNNLYTKGCPDPDILIRTSGEIRLSGFLPWQSTYSEFIFVKKLWPDFTPEDLDEAIKEFNKRNRKFGAK